MSLRANIVKTPRRKQDDSSGTRSSVSKTDNNTTEDWIKRTSGTSDGASQERDSVNGKREDVYTKPDGRIVESLKNDQDVEFVSRVSEVVAKAEGGGKEAGKLLQERRYKPACSTGSETASLEEAAADILDNKLRIICSKHYVEMVELRDKYSGVLKLESTCPITFQIETDALAEEIVEDVLQYHLSVTEEYLDRIKSLEKALEYEKLARQREKDMKEISGLESWTRKESELQTKIINLKIEITRLEGERKHADATIASLRESLSQKPEIPALLPKSTEDDGILTEKKNDLEDMIRAIHFRITSDLYLNRASVADAAVDAIVSGDQQIVTKLSVKKFYLVNAANDDHIFERVRLERKQHILTLPSLMRVMSLWCDDYHKV